MADEVGGDFFGIPSNVFGGIGAGLGAGADIYSFFENLQRQNALKKIYAILSDPTKFASYINKTFQPMSAAENQAVARDYGANWATMTGGAQGGAFTQFAADALAKIESQRYQDAARNALGALTGATGTADRLPQFPIGQLGSIAKALQVLRGINQPPSGGTGLTDFAGMAQRAGERTPFPEPGNIAQQPEYQGATY